MLRARPVDLVHVVDRLPGLLQKKMSLIGISLTFPTHRFDGPAVSYGKDAIVGVDGEMEHGGACVHPMLGKPMRCAIGGGKAVISSNVKVAAVGASLDVPLGHKDDSWSFPHFDTITRVGPRRAAAERDPCRHGDCRRRMPPEPMRD